MNFSSYVSVCYVILTKLIKHIIQVVAELHLLLASPLCHAAGKTATGELAGVISLLDNFAKQLSPSRAEINKFSEFYILVLKRFEPFLRIPGPSDPRDDSSPLTSILVGRDAISYDLRRIKRIIDGGGKDPKVGLETSKFLKKRGVASLAPKPGVLGPKPPNMPPPSHLVRKRENEKAKAAGTTKTRYASDCPCGCENRRAAGFVEFVNGQEAEDWCRCCCVKCGPPKVTGARRCTSTMPYFMWLLAYGFCNDCRICNRHSVSD
jgi:hypothetical protein